MCARCGHFEYRPAQQPDGHCTRYGEPTWRSDHFSCQAYQPSDLERRRLRVEQQLRGDASLRIAADVANASLPDPKESTPAAGAPISILVAVRTPQGIVSGELEAPRERFNIGEFFRVLEQTGGPS